MSMSKQIMVLLSLALLVLSSDSTEKAPSVASNDNDSIAPSQRRCNETTVYLGYCDLGTCQAHCRILYNTNNGHCTLFPEGCTCAHC
ncbi:hypothetical protein ACP4OV_020525 [Aristida adscensionis]